MGVEELKLGESSKVCGEGLGHWEQLVGELFVVRVGPCEPLIVKKEVTSESPYQLTGRLTNTMQACDLGTSLKNQ